MAGLFVDPTVDYLVLYGMVSIGYSSVTKIMNPLFGFVLSFVDILAEVELVANYGEAVVGYRLAKIVAMFLIPAIFDCHMSLKEMIFCVSYGVIIALRAVLNRKNMLTDSREEKFLIYILALFTINSLT